MIETAKANGLSVERYLVYLMGVLSNLEDKDKDKNKDTLIQHMPWSKELPSEVFLQNKDIHNSKN
ncbi:transposase domain-containing protein [Clostridium oryzae]|uniref:transposase domain-containing protein n=1 Tax=Clostridium oryzae TaxID=1450648 RepID=UPI0011161AD6|nr:transposase domain-containing protein [Clostridium oryzae]